MPVFKYLGRDKSGTKIKGSLEANSNDDVIRFLDDRGITPLSIDRLDAPQKTVGDIAEGVFGVRVKQQEVLNFARQMTTLASAGVPIIRGVRQLAKSTRSKGMRKALTGVADGVEAGKSLAAALREYPRIFSGIFVGIVEVGENTGHLDDAFLQLSGFLEKRIANKKRLISAIRYPMLVVSAILVAVIVMNIFVIPKFAVIFKTYKAKLPIATRMLIGFSDFLTNHWLISIGIALGTVVLIKYLLSIKPIRYAWDKYKLRIPVLGSIQHRIIVAQFSWTFSMVLHAGVPVLKGIALSAGVTGNTFFNDKLLGVRDGVDQGENFSRAAAKSGLFDPTSIQMMEVGEETGNLDEMLTKMSLTYESDIDYDLKNLNDLLEPMILAILGVFVAILALAIYLPLWEMTEIIR